jgi:hypothetical protein
MTPLPLGYPEGRLPRIFGGAAGGFPGFVATLFPKGREFRGAERAQIAFEVAPDRAQWGTEIGGKVKAWAKALTGPTSLLTHESARL